MMSYMEKLIKLINVIDTGLTPVRIGNKCDGGYVILKELSEKAAFIYSFGIGDDVGFEVDFADTFPEIESIHLFDPDMDIDVTNDKFIIHKKRLQDSYELIYNSYLDLSNKEKKEKSPILKLDVEWDEWEGFTELFRRSSSPTIFGQIIVEFHVILTPSLKGKTPYFDKFYKSVADKVNENLLRKYYEVMEKLNKFFFCFHIHGNNSLPLINIEGYKIPQLLEMSFVRKDLVSPIKLISEGFPKEGLDFPNKGYRLDINPFYPFVRGNYE